MPGEVYSSHIFSADRPSSILVNTGLAVEGYTDSASGPLSFVAWDSGCADGELFSRNTGSVLLLGTRMVATGVEQEMGPGVGPRVGPGVGPGVGGPSALW